MQANWEKKSIELVNTRNWIKKKKSNWQSIKLGSCVKDIEAILAQELRPGKRGGNGSTKIRRPTTKILNKGLRWRILEAECKLKSMERDLSIFYLWTRGCGRIGCGGESWLCCEAIKKVVETEGVWNRQWHEMEKECKN